MQRLLLFILTATICFSCKKDNTTAGASVEIYLLKTFQTVAAQCQVDPSFAILEDLPTVRNHDILEYSKTNYKFKLTDVAMQKVKTILDRTPFAVTIDNQVIYYGFFKPSFSSSSCDQSITMDIDWSTGNKIALRLGYPAPFPGMTIDDKRNDPKLIATLRQQGKLK